MAVAGYALLGVLALILLALCVPVRFGAAYRTDEKPGAWLAWAFLKFDLVQAAEKRESAPKPPREKKPPKRPERGAQKPPLEFSEQLGLVVDLLGSVKGGAGLLIRSFRLYRIRLHLVVAGEDAAGTAISYGKVNAAVYSAYALAQSFLRMNRPDIDIRPDFVSGRGLVDFEARGRLLPLAALAAGLRIGAAFLVKTIKRRHNEAKPREGSGG